MPVEMRKASMPAPEDEPMTARYPRRKREAVQSKVLPDAGLCPHRCTRHDQMVKCVDAYPFVRHAGGAGGGYPN